MKASIMKLLPFFCVLFSVPCVISSQSVLIGGKGASRASLEVPGENTLSYCKEPTDYIFNIDYIDLSPNPPVPGQNLTITAAGTSSTTIDVPSNAKIFVQVKLGYITLLRKEYDFCDVIDAVDLSCPLEKGYRKLVKEVAIPGAIPPGKYAVTADAYLEGTEKKITCMEGSIVF